MDKQKRAGLSGWERGELLNKLYSEDSIRAIAEAIRQKGVSGQMTVGDMAGKVLEIPTGSADVPFRLGGLNAQKVAEYTETWTLADTSFVIGSSSSTSATSIKAAVSNRFTSPTIALGDKDIVILQTSITRPRYSAAATNKARELGHVGCYYSVISKKPSADGGAKTQRMIYNITTLYQLKYYNSSGTLSRASNNYGLYMGMGAPTFASATAASTTVRCNSPTLSYRCSTSYQSAANNNAVTACDFNWKIEVFTVDPFTTPAAELIDKMEEILVTL